MEFCVKYIRSPGPFISMCKQVILSFTTFINQNVDYILEIFFLEKDKHRVCRSIWKIFVKNLWLSICIQVFVEIL